MFKIGSNKVNVFNPYDDFFDDDHIDGIEIYYVGTEKETHKGGHLRGKGDIDYA